MNPNIMHMFASAGYYDMSLLKINDLVLCCFFNEIALGVVSYTLKNLIIVKFMLRASGPIDDYYVVYNIKALPYRAGIAMCGKLSEIIKSLNSLKIYDTTSLHR